LPVGLRNWFVKRLMRQLEAEQKAMQEASKGNKSSNTHTLSAINQPPKPKKLM